MKIEVDEYTFEEAAKIKGTFNDGGSNGSGQINIECTPSTNVCFKDCQLPAPIIRTNYFIDKESNK